MIKKVGFLTSSRADFGISIPLINALNFDVRFDLTIIAFGMHLEEEYGNTVNEIYQDKLLKVEEVKCMPNGNQPIDISSGQGKILSKFSKFWEKNKFDLVIAIGDRFEMFSAVQASIPFELKLAHIHGGETSLGSIDNVYRDQITIASSIHLTSNIFHSEKVERIKGSKKNIYNIGSLSLYELKTLNLPNWDDVCQKFKIINAPFVLVTFHPETINAENNYKHVKLLKSVLGKISSLINLVITSSNADTYGSIYNDMMFDLSNENPENIFLVDSFGKLNYFSALKHCEFVLGNSSSGLIEVASFNKYTLNVGNRQLGRVRNKNVIDVSFDGDEIIKNFKKLLNNNFYEGDNIYNSEFKLEEIINIIYEF